MNPGPTGEVAPAEPVIAEADAPRRRVAARVSLVLLVVTALLVALLATSPGSDERERSSPLIGQPAPAIEGTTTRGREFSLEALRGRWVVVNFFATWCVPCIEEHPELVRFAEEHAAVGDAAVVSVAFDDTPENVAAFFARNGGSWDVVVEDQERAVLDYGVTGVPESFVVSPSGEVVERIISGVTAEQLDEVIEREVGS